MICKKCGQNIRHPVCSCTTRGLIEYYKNKNEKIPSVLTGIYKSHNCVYYCENCNEPIDYKDMQIDDFFKWLECSSEYGDTREVSGKALIRYFGLDKLLGEKKDAGD